MENSLTIDDIFSDLHVVGSIPENGRLCIADGRLSTESFVPLSFLSWAQLACKRLLNHDNRSHTLMALQNLSLKLKTLQVVPDESKRRFKELLEQAVSGLENLKKTYEQDTSMVSRLSILQDRLKSFAKSI